METARRHQEARRLKGERNKRTTNAGKGTGAITEGHKPDHGTVAQVATMAKTRGEAKVTTGMTSAGDDNNTGTTTCRVAAVVPTKTTAHKTTVPGN